MHCSPCLTSLSVLLAYGLAVPCGCFCLKMPGNVRCILLPGLNALQPVSHFFVTILTTGRITMCASSYMFMLLSEDACLSPMLFVARHVSPGLHSLSLLVTLGLGVTCGCFCLKMAGNVRCILLPGLNALQPVSHFVVTASSIWAVVDAVV